jgi:hypothetical protein
VFKGEDGQISLYDSDGQKTGDLSTVRYDRVSDVFSSLRKGSHAGRSFYMESVNVESAMSFSKALLNKYGK